MKKFWESRIPTILAIMVLVSGIAAGIYLIQNSRVFRLAASPQATPQDVRITNVSANSFTVSWVTDKKTTGSIVWGPSQSLGKQEINGESKNVHSLTLEGLNSQTSYFFKINSDGVEYDNSRIPWEVKTGPDLSQSNSSRVLSGNVVNPDGSLSQNVVVHVTGGGIAPLSSITSLNGTWMIPISQARTSDLSSYANLSDSNTFLDIFVQGGPLGIATAKILIGTDPIPTIVLGSNHDFRSETANINLPTETPKKSGFNIPDLIPTPSSKVVTLESFDEGEVVASTKPEFFGEGPIGTTITITVESELVSQTVKVTTSGWKWSPPQNLSEGVHKISISWKDERGILRQLTRTFIVQASEAPAFESTPSATLTPTRTPTPTPSPTLTPPAGATPTSIPSPTKIPSPTLIPTLPPAGTIFPTIFGFTAGILLVLGSILLAI